MFCEYKNLFGEPGTGIHSYRIMDVAVLDFGVTAIVAWGLSYVFKISFWLSFLLFFITGIFVHRLFCVRTTLDKWLFSSP
jgi:hypothetical protein